MPGCSLCTLYAAPTAGSYGGSDNSIGCGRSGCSNGGSTAGSEDKQGRGVTARCAAQHTQSTVRLRVRYLVLCVRLMCCHHTQWQLPVRIALQLCCNAKIGLRLQ